MREKKEERRSTIASKENGLCDNSGNLATTSLVVFSKAERSSGVLLGFLIKSTVRLAGERKRHALPAERRVHELTRSLRSLVEEG